MYPFSYKELLTYFSDKKKSALTHDDEIKIFNNYLNYGGFPGLLAYDYPDEKITYLTDIYNSIMLKDVIDIEKISSVILFERLMEFIVCNIGKIFSANSIAKYLKLEKYNISTSTVLNYKVCYEFITFISDKKRRSYWKKILKVSEKYYIVDPGFYYLFNDENKRDLGYLLENIVYLELRRHGYKVTIGKLYDIEVDFVCKKPGKTTYIQVAQSIMDPNTRDREFRPLNKIKDNYPKYVLSMDEINLSSNGIIHMNILEFLKADEI